MGKKEKCLNCMHCVVRNGEYKCKVFGPPHTKTLASGHCEYWDTLEEDMGDDDDGRDQPA